MYIRVWVRLCLCVCACMLHISTSKVKVSTTPNIKPAHPALFDTELTAGHHISWLFSPALSNPDIEITFVLHSPPL